MHEKYVYSAVHIRLVTWTSADAAGFCSRGQLCNAKVASEASYDNKRSTEVGVCVTPKTAGSSCTVGTGEKLLGAVHYAKLKM